MSNEKANSVSFSQTPTTITPNATGPITPKKPRKQSKGKQESIKTEKPTIVDNTEVVVSTTVDENKATTPLKLKKPRVRKPKAIKTEGADDVSLINRTAQGIDVVAITTGNPTADAASSEPITKNKRKPKLPSIAIKTAKVKRLSAVKVPKPRPPKTPKSESSPSPTAKQRQKKDSTVSPTVLLDAAAGPLTPSIPPTIIEPKKKRTKKSEIVTSAVEQAELQGNPAPLYLIPIKKPRKPKKSLAELQKIMMAAATVAVKKGDEPNPVVLTNGKFKLTKRRKSSLLSDTGDVSGGAITKNKSIPPKKRKRVVSSLTPLTAHEKSHQDDIINAVACGTFEPMNSMNATVDDVQMNGISRPSLPDGVLMQGVSTFIFLFICN